MAISLDTWHHVVVTFDGGGTHLFLDGVRDESSYSDSTASGVTNHGHLRIAGSFRGAIDELAIYDHALSEERVRAHSSLGRR